MRFSHKRIIFVHTCCIQSMYIQLIKYENVHQWPSKNNFYVKAEIRINSAMWDFAPEKLLFVYLFTFFFFLDCFLWNDDNSHNSQMRMKPGSAAPDSLVLLCSGTTLSHLAFDAVIVFVSQTVLPIYRTKALGPEGQRCNSSSITPKSQLCASVHSIVNSRCDGGSRHHSRHIAYIPSGQGRDEQEF